MAHALRIDSRERGACDIDSLRETHTVEIALLDAGDIIVHDLGIERKTIDDFFRTLTAGQLFPQLRKLKRAFRRQMLSSTVASGVVAVCPLWGAHLLRLGKALQNLL